MRPRTAHWLAACAVVLSAAGTSRAQTPVALVPHSGLPPLTTVSTDEFRARLEALQGLVSACRSSASNCDPAKVGDDNFVDPGNAPAYIERFGWLRELFEDRGDPDHKKRAELLPHAAERLQQQLAELDSPAPATVALGKPARDARAEVLARKEFRTAEGYSLSDRLAAWFSELLTRMFGGVSTLGHAAPWLGAALEWGTLLLALTLLLVWVYRALDRQRVAIGRLHADGATAEAQAESRRWAALAREHADRGEWREAVHALYWASIVVLEDRRTLRRSGTRTPREALRLIDPASHLREPLRAQTGEFERIWYGLQPAAPADYESALLHYQALQAGASARSAA